ncbi:hypothetical protein CC85DRAFT_308173 [Cutaneotrichosporon oleaginosum]|uniref:C2H2-type domain-containing protein n=1 Tax=Cutaneotrichosporon oleaginosum TaxID=879819 RepID=A0A0J1B3E7_9TREE|nr:uncharacterized protein CC85DRAFT_308173 [Cutaneotrichosporon oleaginosum]KLT42164.1 hypothetical protein CC85DRAFT_308173 [Cutaneotrichosporon oleaginosum]TXT11713.1 hypothetical protein COLE_02123 [Cutaneotrichosporon oleaginosum]
MPARRTPQVGPDGSPLPDTKEKMTFGCAFPGCGQTYSRMEYLKRHQRKHQDERPFQCKDCTKAFARSDVLLRHRRRCHPTPPPRDRSSHSPMPPVRAAHPSVPISSSRTSDREASPRRAGASGTTAGRKHARSSGGSASEHPNTRPRLRLSEEEEDEDRYGSRLTRNGMGNGGVFGVSNNYYNGNPVSTDDYTPGLLPMFQNATGPYHNMHDPNHLEDASVLLSMAYPGGVPGSNSNNSETSPADASTNWESADAATLNLLAGDTTNGDAAAAIEAVAAAAAEEDADKPNKTDSSFNSGAADDPARPAAPGALLPESMGNALANAMDWLAGGAGVDNSPDDSAMSDASRLPHFNMTSLFPPNFGSSGLNSGSISNETTAMAIAAAAAAAAIPEEPIMTTTLTTTSTDSNHIVSNSSSEENETAAMVRAILEQLYKNEVPETRSNPHPERPLLRIASKEVLVRAGDECPKSSRFYLPADRFTGCYQIPHWALPPLRTLSVMAARTYYSVLNHFPFVHDPTFQLIDTAACLAFAICTVGGIRLSKANKSTSNLLIGESPAASAPSPLSAGGVWEGVGADFKVAADAEDPEDQRRVLEWEAGQIVRHEKTNMLVKSFSLAQGVLMTDYNVALLQALILYHAPYFLSNNEKERRHANLFLGTIVNITRQIGFFQTGMEHTDPNSHLPPPDSAPADLDRVWRRWIQLESRRRTAYLVYHLDTVSALESSIPPIITPSELASIPLPSPNTLWQAETAQAWAKAVQTYRPMTLDEAMRRTFGLPSSGRVDEVPSIKEFQRDVFAEGEYGPFARTAVVMTLVRGVMDLGEGRRDRGDWRDLTDLWLSTAHLRPADTCFSSDGTDLGPCTQEALRARFALALQRWREGWLHDTMCNNLSASTSPSSEVLTPKLTLEVLNGDHSPRPHGKLAYCEEAMPFFFLAQGLLSKLGSAPGRDGKHRRNAFAETSYSELLDASRTLARAGATYTPSPTNP